MRLGEEDIGKERLLVSVRVRCGRLEDRISYGIHPHGALQSAFLYPLSHRFDVFEVFEEQCKSQGRQGNENDVHQIRGASEQRLNLPHGQK